MKGFRRNFVGIFAHRVTVDNLLVTLLIETTACC